MTPGQALNRRGPSRPCKELALRWITDRALEGEAPRVLDFGCGLGEDVRFLRSLGVDAQGYDPVHGPHKIPRGPFDLILLTYVLNVVPREERERILSTVAGLLAPGGVVIAVTRPPHELRAAAKRGDWPLVEPDGWQSRGTGFQGAVSHREMVALGRRVGLVPGKRPGGGRMESALLQKEDSG